MNQQAKPRLEGKRWEKEFEEPIRGEWKKNRVFKLSTKTDKKIFSIDTPPPYVNTPVHIGHATTYTIQDIIARYKRMCGLDVLFPLGLDRNGLPIEMAAEKKFNVFVNDTPRERFIALCEQMLKETSSDSIDTFYKLGISFNSWELGEGPGDIYYTDSGGYRALTQSTFIDLWKKGLIYKSDRINNYCPECRTTIADSEIQYKAIETHFNYVKFRVKETGEILHIGTTRPELLCSCAVILYNPGDERYRHLKGRTALVPIYEREVPIKAHPYARMEAGTGLMMMCSFGDYTDVRFFREMGLKPIIAVDTGGRMNKAAGFLVGLRVADARERMIEELDRRGLLESQQKIIHRIPICERSKTPVEFIGMSEYYLRQLHLKDDIKRISKGIRFFAPKSRQILADWIDAVSTDWPISRRRYYATEIPLWYCKKCGETTVPPKGRYYRPWKEGPPVKRCPKCKGSEFIPEERVFDTWFDSSISPLYILGYGRSNAFFSKTKPCSLRPQGREIVRTWLYYTLLRCYQLTKAPIFENVWIHYHVLDEKGTKMSKSLGNFIDPHEIIRNFGAEPFRVWCALEGNITLSDMRCSFERIEGASKFLTKLWNVARFISTFPDIKKKPKNLGAADQWIINETSRLVSLTKKGYDSFDFHKPMTEIKHFVWETFASHYLELVKTRAYNHSRRFTKEQQEAAIWTLNHVLKNILLIISPVACFISRRIYEDMYNGRPEEMGFPKPEKPVKLPFTSEELMETSRRIWKAKKDRGLSLRAPAKEATVPKSLSCLEDDLRPAHNIERIGYGKTFSIRL